MPRTAAELLEEARQLPRDEQLRIAEVLLGELPEDRQGTIDPELGYEAWFRAGVEEALTDRSPDTPHEQVVEEVHELLNTVLKSRRLKASA